MSELLNQTIHEALQYAPPAHLELALMALIEEACGFSFPKQVPITQLFPTSGSRFGNEVIGDKVAGQRTGRSVVEENQHQRE